MRVEVVTKIGSTSLAVLFLLCGTELFAEPYGGGVTYPNTVQVGGSSSFLGGFGISPGTPPNSGQLLGNTVYYRQFRPGQGGFPASAGFSGDAMFGGGGGGGGGGTGGYDYPPDDYPDDPPDDGGEPIVPHTPAPGASLLGAIGLGIVGLTRRRTLA